MQLVPSIFKGRGNVGDFEWMIDKKIYEDALFIFNDNEAQFLRSCGRRGKGNAVIRPHQKKNPPRCSGVPTGNYIPGKVCKGYSTLTDEVKSVIDLSFIKIQKILATGQYKRVFYSATTSGDLGTGIFKVGKPVKDYILVHLKALCN